VNGLPARLRVREQGGIPIEAALLVPVLLSILTFVVAAGRVETDRAFLDAAARSAARAASISRTEQQAQTTADQAVSVILSQQGVSCKPSVKIYGVRAAVRKKPGAPAFVTAVITCTVPLSDLDVFKGLPLSVKLRSRFISAVDIYRAPE
jgi:Flp pilus assembly protein TadG